MPGVSNTYTDLPPDPREGSATLTTPPIERVCPGIGASETAFPVAQRREQLVIFVTCHITPWYNEGETLTLVTSDTPEGVQKARLANIRHTAHHDLQAF